MSSQELHNLETAQLCLDYVNTLSYRYSTHPEEHLENYISLLDWAQNAGLLVEDEAGQLRQLAKTQPAEAELAFKEAIGLRESLCRILAAQVRSSSAVEGDLQAFNRSLGGVMGHSRLSAGPNCYQWGWNEELSPRLERPWWPVVHSAAELLTSPQLLERLGQCADPQCGWLFLDTSKSRTRKWCDINDCGNRAKQRKFQEKKRGREKIGNN